jgi:hypothetical protein
MGKWGNGRMGKWESGKVGKWEKVKPSGNKCTQIKCI